MDDLFAPFSMPRLTAGVDEAGRGPLAGPIYASAVILNPRQPIAGLDDSKKLSAAKREQLFAIICREALAYSICKINAPEIDQINILQATFKAMRNALSRLATQPQYALIDGNLVPPDLPCQAQAVVGGDAIHACISAASILAKVARDQYMQDMDKLYPDYGFGQHKGYGVKAHLEALETLGPCPIHRQSFKPVRKSNLL